MHPPVSWAMLRRSFSFSLLIRCFMFSLVSCFTSSVIISSGFPSSLIMQPLYSSSIDTVASGFLSRSSSLSESSSLIGMTTPSSNPMPTTINSTSILFSPSNTHCNCSPFTSTSCSASVIMTIFLLYFLPLVRRWSASAARIRPSHKSPWTVDEMDSLMVHRTLFIARRVHGEGLLRPISTRLGNTTSFSSSQSSYLSNFLPPPQRRKNFPTSTSSVMRSISEK
mmetsp:Transcript_26375/g.63294  ORF Transcript_26375/g.63294 Transcript_26375/m.63294 type:complete len:224 (+) Transcript_26375:1042-1713(+)